MPRPTSVSTIGDLIAGRYRLSFTCGGCGKLREIDLPKLAAAIGADFDFYRSANLPPAERLPVKCAECGGKPIGYILSPWTLPPE